MRLSKYHFIQHAFLIITILGSYSSIAQTLDKFKLAADEVPEGYTVSEKMLCKSIQPKIFYDNPDLYSVILGKVKSKDFQSFESKDDHGTVLFFEYEKKVEGEGFLDGLLWGGSKPTKDHPEEYLIKDNILVIWSFSKNSKIKEKSKEKFRVATNESSK